MPILYKSSKYFTYSYYIITPFSIAFFLFLIIAIVSHSNFNLIFIIFLFICFSCLFISEFESILKLKYIEVSEDCILINHKKTIEYKNIVYVYNLRYENGYGLVLWYLDIKTNKLKVILVFPEKENSVKYTYRDTLFNTVELQVTKFIKEKAIKSNPHYLNINNRRYFLFSISPTFKIF